MDKFLHYNGDETQYVSQNKLHVWLLVIPVSD